MLWIKGEYKGLDGPNKQINGRTENNLVSTKWSDFSMPWDGAKQIQFSAGRKAEMLKSGQECEEEYLWDREDE